MIYGGIDRKQYIIETVGCGVAFIDYDNDGWLDIFLLSGTRLEGPPDGCTNRLYKNNRDGTFTDVTEKAGLHRTGWASAVCVGDYNNDGFDDLFVTYWGQNVLYRNNGDGTFTDVTEKAGLLRKDKHWGSGCTSSTTIATAISICSSPATSNSISSPLPRRARTAIATGRACPSIAARAACRPALQCSTATTATAPSPTSATHPASAKPKAVTA